MSKEATHTALTGVVVSVQRREIRVTGGGQFAALGVAAEIASLLKQLGMDFAFEGGDITGVTLDNRAEPTFKAWDLTRVMPAIREICRRPPLIT